jgi:hypothetical protein
MSNLREIWLVHHTHVDIGYTEPQSVIVRKHADFIVERFGTIYSPHVMPHGLQRL